MLVMMVVATYPMLKRCDIDSRKQGSHDGIEVDFVTPADLDVPEVAFVAHVVQLDESTYANEPAKRNGVPSPLLR